MSFTHSQYLVESNWLETHLHDSNLPILDCTVLLQQNSDAFILTLLGKRNVAVYDGSLLEWAMDPNLPLETN